MSPLSERIHQAWTHGAVALGAFPTGGRYSRPVRRRSGGIRVFSGQLRARTGSRSRVGTWWGSTFLAKPVPPAPPRRLPLQARPSRPSASATCSADLTRAADAVGGEDFCLLQGPQFATTSKALEREHPRLVMPANAWVALTLWSCLVRLGPPLGRRSRSTAPPRLSKSDSVETSSRRLPHRIPNTSTQTFRRAP